MVWVFKIDFLFCAFTYILREVNVFNPKILFRYLTKYTEHLKIIETVQQIGMKQKPATQQQIKET